MALKVPPGSSITFELRTQDPETLAPQAGLPVFLDFISAPAAAPQQIGGGQTDGQGRAAITTAVPSVAGTYRYRARTPGIADRFRSDTSSQVPVEVVA